METIFAYTIHPIGDCGFQIAFQHKPSKELYLYINSVSASLEISKIEGVVEFVPAYQTITIYVDPSISSYEEIVRKIKLILSTPSAKNLENKTIVHIPVCYDEEYAPDLKEVAQFHGLSEDEVILHHSSQEYFVFMLGFLPGFPYLLGLPEKLTTPRKSTPRLKVPKGSVGIGGSQTGIYPIESPGGWNLIGKTPVSLFDPHSHNPFLLNSGEYIHFKAITKEQYMQIKREISDGIFKVKKEVIPYEN